MDIPPELVEQENKRQATAWLIGPVIELALAGLVDIIGKFLLALVIEDGILTEPDVHAPVDLRRR